MALQYYGTALTHHIMFILQAIIMQYCVVCKNWCKKSKNKLSIEKVQCMFNETNY